MPTDAAIDPSEKSLLDSLKKKTRTEDEKRLIFENFYPPSRNWICKQFKNQFTFEDAEEIASEALRRTLVIGRAFKTRNMALSYIFEACKTIAVDRLRIIEDQIYYGIVPGEREESTPQKKSSNVRPSRGKTASRPIRVMEESAYFEYLPDHSARTAESLEASNMHQNAMERFRRLDMVSSEILELAKERELPYKEIASRIGIAESSVATYVARALEAYHAILVELGMDPLDYYKQKGKQKSEVDRTRKRTRKRKDT